MRYDKVDATVLVRHEDSIEIKNGDRQVSLRCLYVGEDSHGDGYLVFMDLEQSCELLKHLSQAVAYMTQQREDSEAQYVPEEFDTSKMKVKCTETNFVPHEIRDIKERLDKLEEECETGDAIQGHHHRRIEKLEQGLSYLDTIDEHHNERLDKLDYTMQLVKERFERLELALEDHRKAINGLYGHGQVKSKEDC